MLQVHAALPVEPVHVCRAPHAVGALYDKQPVVLSSAHVARPPETHAVCPLVHEFVHVVEQAAFGAAPEHDCVPGHAAVALT